MSPRHERSPQVNDASSVTRTKRRRHGALARRRVREGPRRSTFFGACVGTTRRAYSPAAEFPAHRPTPFTNRSHHEQPSSSPRRPSMYWTRKPSTRSRGACRSARALSPVPSFAGQLQQAGYFSFAAVADPTDWPSVERCYRKTDSQSRTGTLSPSGLAASKAKAPNQANPRRYEFCRRGPWLPLRAAHARMGAKVRLLAICAAPQDSSKRRGEPQKPRFPSRTAVSLTPQKSLDPRRV